MWGEVAAQSIAAGIGALIGALAAVVIARMGVKGQVRRVETAALNELVLELSFRRALVVSDPHQLTEDEASRLVEDRERAVRSVFDIRTEVKKTRTKLRVESPAFDPLARMTAACNRFLEGESRDPLSYLIGLHQLQSDLHEQARALHAHHEKVLDLEPGTSAF